MEGEQGGRLPISLPTPPESTPHGRTLNQACAVSHRAQLNMKRLTGTDFLTPDQMKQGVPGPLLRPASVLHNAKGRGEAAAR